jgi:hypothetical protein
MCRYIMLLKHLCPILFELFREMLHHMWETVVGITGIYSGVGGRGEPAERGELTAEEATGMICAKCELRESLENSLATTII